MDLNDGNPHAVTGDLRTIMAGLACGVPSKIAWPILKDYADAFVSIPDYVAAPEECECQPNPFGNDPRIISGESGGGIGIGLLTLLSENQSFSNMKEALKLNNDSQILIISTEGDTDPNHYRKIVWDGAYPFYQEV